MSSKNNTVEPDNNIKKHLRYGLKKTAGTNPAVFFTIINGKRSPERISPILENYLPPPIICKTFVHILFIDSYQ